MDMLRSLASGVAWVAGLWMVYKLFRRKGILHGILGLICDLYPFIWGLIHFKESDIKTPMTLWLVALLVSVILVVIDYLTPGTAQSASFLHLFM